MDKLITKSNNVPTNKGFSIIELMIAMVIILTAITGTVLITSSGTQNQLTGSQNFLIGGQTNAEALQKAKELLETAQAQARKDFRMVNATPIPPTKSTDGYYSWWTDVTSSPSVPTDYFTKQVTSHVEWRDSSNILRNVKLSTLVTNFENAIGGDTCNSFITGNWASPQTTNILFSNLISNDTTGTYQVSDVDAYSTPTQKRLYVSTSNSSQSVGPNNPSSSINDASTGTLSWTNPTNVFSSNNAYATRTMNGTALTNYLKITNLGLNIPQGATILGITVDIERSRTGGSTGEVQDNEVKLVKGDGTFGTTNKATTTNWPTADAYASYGNTTDLWGQTWSAASSTNTSATNINSSNFGILFSAKGTISGTNRVANVDHVRITVTYIKQLYILDTSTPTSPTRIGEIASSTTAPSAGVGFNAIATDGHYVYAAVNAVSGGQLEIIDISSSPYSVIKTFSVPGVTGTTGVGKSIFYKNGYVYLGLASTNSGGPEFHIIDIHNPSIPSEVGSWPSSSLGNDISSIKIRGQYAYLSTPNAQELKVLSISNPSSPSLVANYDAPDAVGNGKGLDLVGDTLYLGRTVTASNPELYLIDISNPTSIPNTPKGTKEIGSSINALFIRDYLAFLLNGTSTGAGQLQILDVSNPTSISAKSSVNLPNTTAGISSETIDCEGNYMYISSVPSSGTFLNKGSISVITAI